MEKNRKWWKIDSKNILTGLLASLIVIFVMPCGIALVNGYSLTIAYNFTKEVISDNWILAITLTLFITMVSVIVTTNRYKRENKK